MITVTGVTVRRAGVTVLDDVTFTVDPGELILLVGRNGAGKTTLLDLLCGLDRPASGTVCIDGRTVAEQPTTRTSVGRVFEDPDDQILGSTAAADVAFGPENLGLSREEIQRRVTAALDVVGLSPRSDDPVDALSGGQRARLAIAGALAMEPTYLLLDEPTAGLDHPSRRAVLTHLETVNDDGTAVVMATHDLRDLDRVADRVLGLDGGTIAVDAPPSEAAGVICDLGVRVPDGWGTG